MEVMEVMEGELVDREGQLFVSRFRFSFRGPALCIFAVQSLVCMTTQHFTYSVYRTDKIDVGASQTGSIVYSVVQAMHELRSKKCSSPLQVAPVRCSMHPC